MKYAYVNAVLLDGTENMEPKTGLAVLTDGERITDIVPVNADLAGYLREKRQDGALQRCYHASHGGRR